MSVISGRLAATIRTTLQSKPSWLVPCLGPLICLLLHWLSFSIINYKVVTRLISAVPSHGPMLSAHKQWLFVGGLFGSFIYTILPFLALVIIVCVDILRRDGVNYTYLLRMTCISFYVLLPYLGVVFCLSLAFVPPDPIVQGNLSLQEVLETTRDYRTTVQLTTTMSIIRVVGILAYLSISILLAAGYRAFSRCSFRFATILGVGVAGFLLSFVS